MKIPTRPNGKEILTHRNVNFFQREQRDFCQGGKFVAKTVGKASNHPPVGSYQKMGKSQ